MALKLVIMKSQNCRHWGL